MIRRSHHSIAFFDHLRVLLTGLFILHHCAVMFGAPGVWYLRVPAGDAAMQVPLTFFTTVNQAFLPACVFLLSGYFTPAACARKGWRVFLRDRLLRLGVPLLLYGVVLGPLTAALARRRDNVELFDLGPCWYLLALLLLSTLYALWRVQARRLKLRLRTPRAPGFAALLAMAACCAGLAFVLRLGGPLQLPALPDLETGSLASACLLFFAGTSLARSRWLERISADDLRPWCIIAALAIPVLCLYAGATCAYADSHGDVAMAYRGGWASLGYALWEPLLAWGLILDLLYRFRSTPQRASPSPAWRWWSESAYAACLVHPPVVTALGLLLLDAPLNNGVRFLIAGGAGIVLSFLLARAVVRIPAAKRILS
ncbi:acyltransferase family protein [Duganella sp. PWIR1]